MQTTLLSQKDWVNGCLMKWSEFCCFLPVVQGAKFNGKSTGTTTVNVLQINSSSCHSFCHSTWELRIGCFHYEKHNHGPETWWSLWSLRSTQKNKSFWVYFPQSACLILSRYGQPRHSVNCFSRWSEGCANSKREPHWCNAYYISLRRL